MKAVPAAPISVPVAVIPVRKVGVEETARFVRMFHPFIEKEKCTRCRECAKICPKDVLEAEDGEIMVSDPRSCTGCEACEAVCPERALRVEEI